MREGAVPALQPTGAAAGSNHGQLARRFYRNGGGARSVMEVIATEIKKLQHEEDE